MTDDPREISEQSYIVDCFVHGAGESAPELFTQTADGLIVRLRNCYIRQLRDGESLGEFIAYAECWEER